jgi:ABC-type transport system involved in multi-copper enzyme maturation permease subunit
MNKYISIFLILIAVSLIVYNTTLLNFDNVLQGDSIIALIGIVASLCAIVILVIYMMSKKIQRKIKEE